LSIIQKFINKLLNDEFEFTVPHFFEEMASDDLDFNDIKNAVKKGRIQRKFKHDPRGIRYEIIGPSIDGRKVAIICRIKNTGKLLFITTYVLE